MKPVSASPFDNEEPTQIQAPPPVAVQAQRMEGNWFPIKGMPSKSEHWYGRPLTYKEIKRVSYASEDTIDDALIEVSKSAVRNTDPSKQILDCDLRYVFLWIRAHSLLDPRFNMVFTCTEESCGKEVSFKLEPSDIETFEIETVMTGYSLTLSTGATCVIGLPTAERVRTSKKIERLYAEEEGIEIDSLIASHVLKCSEVENGDVVKIFEWMDSLPPEDVLAIHDMVATFDCGISDIVVKPCPHCKKTNNIELDMTAVFFFPAV